MQPALAEHVQSWAIVCHWLRTLDSIRAQSEGCAAAAPVRRDNQESVCGTGARVAERMHRADAAGPLSKRATPRIGRPEMPTREIVIDRLLAGERRRSPLSAKSTSFLGSCLPGLWACPRRQRYATTGGRRKARVNGAERAVSRQLLGRGRCRAWLSQEEVQCRRREQDERDDQQRLAFRQHVTLAEFV